MFSVSENTTNIFIVWATLLNQSEVSFANESQSELAYLNSTPQATTVTTAMAAEANSTVPTLLSLNSTLVLHHNSSNSTNTTIVFGPIEWNLSKIGIFIAQLILISETVIGNFLVVASVALEKKLQTPFNYYIVNLALTDMNVGLSVMTMFTINNLYGYFPFNWFACCYWVWSDYTMTFESVATLAAISIDRFWSVTWTLHYRNHNSGRKSLLIILITWAFVNTLWLPAFISDRLNHEYAPGECYWDPTRNLSSVIYVGILGYYTPLLIMLAAYVRIFYVMRRRIRQIAETKKIPEATAVTAIQVEEASISQEQSQMNPPVAANKKLAKMAARGEADAARARKEKKAFYTLGHIVIAFLICWIPFYVLFLVDPLTPGDFPTAYVDFAYWMAYLNSAVNPIVYGVGNDDFRRSFKNILLCKFCRKR